MDGRFRVLVRVVSPSSSKSLLEMAANVEVAAEVWLPECGSFLRHVGAAGAGRCGPDSPLCAAITPLVRPAIRGLLTVTERAPLPMDSRTSH